MAKREHPAPIGAATSISALTQNSAPKAAVSAAEPRPNAVEAAKRILVPGLIALVIALVFRTFLFHPFTVPITSMEPNFLRGDYIVTTKWDYGYSKYSFPVVMPFIKGRIFDHTAKRGDIVVFKFAEENRKDSLKRIIGLPGDKVQVVEGHLFVNGSVVKTQQVIRSETVKAALNATPLYVEELPTRPAHLIQNTGTNPHADNTQIYSVPQGTYFVMADNRDYVLDSRFEPNDKTAPGIGFLPEEKVVGRAVLVLMSWKEGSSIWKPWTWFNFRWDRFFKSVT